MVLSNSSIAHAIEEVDAFFESSGILRKDRIRLRLLIVFILVIQLSVASPKVPGGIMATFTLLLNQLGLPLDAVGMLMVANVFCVNLDTAIGMIIRDLDLMDIAV